ncbi:NAD(P)-dependent oxidoreductase [Rhodococcus koreensis]
MNEQDFPTAGKAVGDALRVGFIGLGSQGGPMARRIIEAGFPTTLWARRPESLVPYEGTGAELACSPRELARKSDLVCVCVVDDVGVESLLCGQDGILAGMAPGGIVAIHSTIHPSMAMRMHELAKVQGVELVDAPVSGGGPAAEAGRLLVMAGGDEALIERVRPVFATYADPIMYMGPVGAGQLTKLLNNTIFAAQLATAADILAIGAGLGVDAGRLAEVISFGTGASTAMKIVGSRKGDLSDMARVAGPLLRKDVSILAEVVNANGAEERLGASSGIVWQAADSALQQMNNSRSSF